MLAFLLALVQTVPGNITKVPRDAGTGTGICYETQTVTELPANVAHDVVMFVDAMRHENRVNDPLVPHRYQVLTLWAMPTQGVAFRWEYPVRDDVIPVCPSGTPNAGTRPHVVTMPGLPAGSYQVMGTMLDRITSTGTLEPALLTRIPESTTPFVVTVK